MSHLHVCRECGAWCPDERTLSVLNERVRVLEELLGRVIKYAREDKAVTPGFTRLARVVDEAFAALSGSKGEAGE